MRKADLIDYLKYNTTNNLEVVARYPETPDTPFSIEKVEVQTSPTGRETRIILVLGDEAEC